MTKLNVGAQLYTLRDFAKTPSDIARTIARLKKIGYDAVQVSGIGPIEPEELKQIMDNEGITIAATHTSWEKMRDYPEQVIAEHSLWECRYTAIGGLPEKDKSEGGDAVFGRGATLVARASGGSLGRALRMRGDVFLKKRDAWISRLLQLPRLTKGDALEMAMETATKEKGRGLDDPEEGEPGLLEMLALWGGWYRDLLIVKVGGPKQLIMNVDFRDQLKNVARNIALENLMDSLLVVDQAIRDLRRMGNAQLVMGHAMLNLQSLAASRGD